mgnify:CR=1 FL=1
MADFGIFGNIDYISKNTYYILIQKSVTVDALEWQVTKKLTYDKQKNEVKIMTDNFEFRSIHPDEVEQAIAIEQICFPPNEACSPKAMTERIAKVPQLFLVAVDKSTGKLAGFLNGVATDEEKFRDEFFTDIDLCDENGKNVMLLGLDVLPEYRGQGLARELVYRYSRRERANGRKKLFLTCLEQKVEMYKKFGLQDLGIADSTWGGEEWHEMVLKG